MASDLDARLNRLNEVCDRITAAARGAGREPASVKLIAVTKTFGTADILPVLGAGHRLFGENRVQEAKAKWPDLKLQYPNIELHLIGPLQSNKAREAVALFENIRKNIKPNGTPVTTNCTTPDAVKDLVKGRMLFWDGLDYYDGAEALFDYVQGAVNTFNQARIDIALPIRIPPPLEQISLYFQNRA